MTAPSPDLDWADRDRAVQIEDDDPESLAGDEIEFNENDDADAGDDDEGAQ